MRSDGIKNSKLYRQPTTYALKVAVGQRPALSFVITPGTALELGVRPLLASKAMQGGIRCHLYDVQGHNLDVRNGARSRRISDGNGVETEDFYFFGRHQILHCQRN